MKTPRSAWPAVPLLMAVAVLCGGWPRASAVAAHGAGQVPATQAVRPAELKFTSDAGAVFYTVKADSVEAFESVVKRIVEAVAAAPGAIAARPSARWRLFRQREPISSGAIVYLSLIEGPAPDVDYSFARVLPDLIPGEARALFDRYTAAMAGGVVTANYKSMFDFRAKVTEPAAKTGAPAPVAPAPVPSVPAAAPAAAAPAAAAAVAPPVDPSARVFAADVGMLFYYVKGDRTQEFEKTLERVGAAVTTSTRPERRQQAKGWRVFRQAEPRGTHGVVVYVCLLDPAVKGENYALSQILAEAFPDEAKQLIVAYNNSNADGMSLANYDLIATIK